MQSTPWGPRPDSWQIVPWASFATPAGEPIVVEPDSDLKQVTVRVRHRGVVERKVSKNKKRVIGTPNQKQIRAGQFIISRIDARNGACGFVPKDLDGAIVTSSFRAFDLDFSIVDSQYFDYLVSMPIFWKLCESISDGSTNRVCLDMDLFDSFVFPLPPLSEQKEVSTILHSVDKAIKETENVITKTEQLRDALLTELITKGLPGHHKKWKEVSGLGTVPLSWQVVRLGDISEIVMGQSPPGHTVFDRGSITLEEEGLPFIQGNAEFGELYPTPVKWCNKPPKIVNPGTILISVRAPVGEMNRVVSNMSIGRGLAAIHFPEQDRDFGWYAINKAKHHLDRIAQGSTFEAISYKDLVALKIPYPVSEERNIIACILKKVEIAIRKIKVELNFATMFKDAIRHSLLRM